MMGPVGGEDQQLGKWIHLLLRIEQSRTQSFPESSSTGLTCSDHVHPAIAQFTCQQAQLRRFSATVYSFKSDENARHVDGNLANFRQPNLRLLAPADCRAEVACGAVRRSRGAPGQWWKWRV